MTEQIIQKVLNFLDKNNIKYELLNHKAVFTVEDVNSLDIKIPGVGAKTLFLRDRKGKSFYLVAIEDSKRIDLKKFAQEMGEKRLNFATEQNLEEFLQVKPGSISPMALVNDKEQKVNFCIDKDLFNAKKVAVHPNLNTATLIIDQENFHRYLNLIRLDFRIFKV